VRQLEEVAGLPRPSPQPLLHRRASQNVQTKRAGSEGNGAVPTCADILSFIFPSRSPKNTRRAEPRDGEPSQQWGPVFFETDLSAGLSQAPGVAPGHAPASTSAYTHAPAEYD
jgi:hypothetical protein